MRSTIRNLAAPAAILAAGLALANPPSDIPGLPRAPADADYRPVDPAEARLGQLLFYDKLLSGGENIACATCHAVRFGTSDGVSLGLGEGGIGMGPARTPDPADLPEQRVPRNATPLFNLGATEFVRMFWDGRVEADPTRPGGFRTPLEEMMMPGFDSVLSAQTMFPVLSPDEMAGHYAESDVSKLVRSGRITGPGGAWDKLARRVAAVPDYARMFAEADPEIAAGRPIAFTDISNAIAAFIEFEWRSDDSPFDRWLRGEATLPPDALAGARIFYGQAGCGECHSGPFLTDQDFHAMGEPQLGPGKAERFEHHSRDLGRMRVTGDAADAYAFRTPSLRNVALSGPWGHAGAHSDLSEFLRYHADPRGAAYVPAATLPAYEPAKPDWAAENDPAEHAAILAAVTTPPVVLSEADIAQLRAFLDSLTGDLALKGRLGVPDAVPSGLPVDR